jgi:hypothetical protein
MGKTSGHGTGHYFIELAWFHLDFTLFSFPVRTAQFIGKFLNNRLSGTSDEDLRAKRGALAAPTGEARLICSAIRIFFLVFFGLFPVLRLLAAHESQDQWYCIGAA